MAETKPMVSSEWVHQRWKKLGRRALALVKRIRELEGLESQHGDLGLHVTLIWD